MHCNSATHSAHVMCIWGLQIACRA